MLIDGDQENSSPYPDNESIFAKKLDAAFRLGTLNDVRLEAPLAHKMKEDIVRLGFLLKVPYELTWSCDNSYTNDEGKFVYCGECGCCYSSALAFVKSKIPDPRRHKYHHLGEDIINDLKRYNKLEWYLGED